ncbi:hypothetical protein LINGRAHAP2_LOCUS22103 [Linum grandiflorum]
MRAIVNELQLAWTLGIRQIRVQSDWRAVIVILAKDSNWIINMRPLFFSSRSFGGKSIFLTFIVKQIMPRII